MHNQKHIFSHAFFLLTPLSIFLGAMAVQSLSYSNVYAEENPEIYYYYNTLNSDQQGLYTNILTGLENMNSDITFPTDWEDGEIDTIAAMITHDHPEIFWYTGAYQYSWTSSSTTFVPEYSISKDEKESREQQIETSTSDILGSLSQQPTDYDKIKMVFEYLIDTVDYDLNAEDNQNIYSALVNKSTVCTGYARATQYLLQKSGVECLMVEGTADSGSHAWDIVCCDGSFYHVDTTFGDVAFTDAAAYDVSAMPENLRYSYIFLCADDSTMLQGRTIADLLPVPACSSDLLNYYKINNLYFSDTSSAENALVKSVQDGQHGFDCQFSDEGSYSEYINDIVNNFYSQNILNVMTDMTSVGTSYTYDDEHYVVKVWY